MSFVHEHASSFSDLCNHVATSNYKFTSIFKIGSGKVYSYESRIEVD